MKSKINFVKPLFFLAVIIFSAFLIISVKNITSVSGYFNIKKIIIKGVFRIDPPRHLLNKNLFNLDLKAIEKRLYFDYPSLEDIKIIRSLPDTLIIQIKARIPVAKLELRKTYFIGAGGEVIDLPFDEKNIALPRITGFENKSLANIKKKDLNIALTLISEYGKIGHLKEYPLGDINLSDLSEAYFTFKCIDFARRNTIKSAEIKVIIGKDDIAAKLKVLASLISKIESSLSEIKYIDLRFDNPVAGK